MKKKYTLTRCWISVFVLFVLTPMAFAQENAKQIDDLMRKYVENGQFNGSLLVAENGKVIFKKGYGMANMEWAIPNAPDTKFRLGSLTKQFTAMLIMQLVEGGKLKLEGKITDYLTDYPKANGDKITIHHLLTHTSGIPNYTGLPGFQEKLSRNPYKPTDFIKQFSDLPLEFEPGSRFAYSNSGYFLLGVLIEKVTGKTYGKVLQENIFKPLGMNNTGYDVYSTILPKQATGYEKRGLTYVKAPYIDMSIPYSAGSLYSTVEDLALWDQALYSDNLLSASSKATLFTPYKSGYAYGWFVGKRPLGQLKDSLQVMDHAGGIDGFHTVLSRLPENKHLVVLLNNTGFTNLDAMRDNIFRILYNQPIDTPRISVAYVVGKSLETTSLENVLKQYREIKKQPSYYLYEREINQLGYILMGENKIKEAIAIFTLNVEEYPQSANVYDSRGEAYLLNGEKTQAIIDYKKSLQLDRYNFNAIKKLNEMGEKVAGPKEVLLTANVKRGDFRAYEGYYKFQFQPGKDEYIKIMTKNNQLVLMELWSGNEITFEQQSQLEFLDSQKKFPLKFTKTKEGAITQVLAFNKDLWIKTTDYKP
jgi:CubicO group peptidase (beta-lactamase class C family)